MLQLLYIIPRSISSTTFFSRWQGLALAYTSESSPSGVVAPLPSERRRRICGGYHGRGKNPGNRGTRQLWCNVVLPQLVGTFVFASSTSQLVEVNVPTRRYDHTASRTRSQLTTRWNIVVPRPVVHPVPVHELPCGRGNIFLFPHHIGQALRRCVVVVVMLDVAIFLYLGMFIVDGYFLVYLKEDMINARNTFTYGARKLKM